MNLLDRATEDFIMIDELSRPDGRGGLKTIYVEGAPFQAAATKDTSTEAKIAEKDGFTAVYTILTKRAINLPFNKIVKRVSDGFYFRITSEGADGETPKGAGLDIREVTAEKWEKPHG